MKLTIISMVINTVIRNVHNPTKDGFADVQAGGNIVSKEVLNPISMDNPVTLAVIELRVAAASASVEIWPIDTIEATESEYSKA